MSRLVVALLGSCLALGACAPAADEDLLTGDPSATKADDGSEASQVSHGPAQFGAAVRVDMTASFQLHHWQFTLDAPARVTVHAEQKVNDLVGALYIYAIGADGSFTQLARGAEVELAETLDAGTYRIYSHALGYYAVGHFELHATCEGEGCPAEDCVLGQDWDSFITADVPPIPVSFLETLNITVASPIHEAWLVEVARIAGIPAVATPDDLAALVDGGTVNRQRLGSAAAGYFDAITFTIAGRRHGAVVSTPLIRASARLLDGQILDCKMRRKP